MKFKNKPHTIDAIQWTGDNADECSRFTSHDFQYAPSTLQATLYVNTSNTRFPIDKGTWLIKEDNGHYPCIDAEFQARYNPVADADSNE